MTMTMTMTMTLLRASRCRVHAFARRLRSEMTDAVTNARSRLASAMGASTSRSRRPCRDAAESEANESAGFARDFVLAARDV